MSHFDRNFFRIDKFAMFTSQMTEFIYCVPYYLMVKRWELKKDRLYSRLYRVQLVSKKDETRETAAAWSPSRSPSTKSRSYDLHNEAWYRGTSLIRKPPLP